MKPNNSAQLDLMIPTPELDFASDTALRAAFLRSPLARRMSFEQAMRIPPLAIAVRNSAEAIARRLKAHPCPTRATANLATHH